MAHAPDPRFVFVTGKGGVGKTTVCAARALALAARGQRVLVAMCNAKERLSTMLGAPPVGPEITEVAERVWAVNIDPERALVEYGGITLKSRALVSLIFDNRYVRAFFRATPGVHEWAMLGKAWWHTTEIDDAGRPRFDVVMVDAPATGHGLDMLRVPKVIVEVVPPGILRRDAERAWSMFRDPAQTGVIVVSLPEELPATETTELVASLRGELGLPVRSLVVNRVLPPLFDERERSILMDAPEDDATPAGRALRAAGRRAERERVQARSLATLASLGLPTVHLPVLFRESTDADAVRELSRRF